MHFITGSQNEEKRARDDYREGDSLPLADGLGSVVLSTSQTCIIKIWYKNKNKLFIKARGFFCHIFSQYILQSAVLLLWSDTPKNHSQLFQCEFPPGHAEQGEWIDIYWHFLICRVLGKQLSRAECEALKGQVAAKQERMPGCCCLTKRC